MINCLPALSVGFADSLQAFGLPSSVASDGISRRESLPKIVRFRLS